MFLRSAASTVLLMFVVAVAFGGSSALAQPRPATECREWHDCRRLALEAAERHEYETFHDLAWRAIQTGPRNDPGLMEMLARAQSLSGRAHDALVMLERLAQMGVAVDAETSDDFARVRALPGWPDVEALIANVRAGTRPSKSAPAARPEPAAAPPALAPAAPAAPPAPATTAPAARATVPEAGRPPKLPERAATRLRLSAPARVDEAVHLSLPRFAAGGLAYDAVSGRFVVGDRGGRKLIVVEDGADHAVDLVRADSAGFRDIRALAIDDRSGDLWVATASPDDREWSIHRLQLVSGRLLKTVPVAVDGPTDLVDLAIAPGGVVFALDAAGGRLLELRPGSSAIARTIPLPIQKPVSIAPGGDDGIVYVAGATGISRLDTRTSKASTLEKPAGMADGAIERIRWHNNALLAVVADAAGSRQLVRLDLNASGRAVTSETIIDDTIPATSVPTFATVSRDELFYVAAEPDASRDQPDAGRNALAPFIVRRVRLR